MHEIIKNLEHNYKTIVELIDAISKKLKYTESNQVDIMSIMTRVIALENRNKEFVANNGNDQIIETDDTDNTDDIVDQREIDPRYAIIRAAGPNLDSSDKIKCELNIE